MQTLTLLQRRPQREEDLNVVLHLPTTHVVQDYDPSVPLKTEVKVVNKAICYIVHIQNSS